MTHRHLYYYSILKVSGPEVIKHFSCSAQMSMQIILLIDVKMPTIEPVSWPQGYKTFFCSTQLSLKFILLINVKMPTIEPVPWP